MKLPAFQFYPGDWLKDPNLRRCTHAAKGVWIDLLCLMHESEERGVLVTSQRAWSDDEIALAVGGDNATTLACLQELTLKGVANRRTDGALYSKRLVRDEHKRALCKEAGKKGGNPKITPTLKGQSKGVDKGGSKGDANPNPTPSSSTSSSTSIIEHTPREGMPKSVDEVKAIAERFPVTSTVPSKPDDGFCEWWFDAQESSGWTDDRGTPWSDWRAAFNKSWRANVHRGLQRGSRTRPPGPSRAQAPQHANTEEQL